MIMQSIESKRVKISYYEGLFLNFIKIEGEESQEDDDDDDEGEK